MTRRLVFQHPDLATYLDRGARMWDVLHGSPLTAAAIVAIQREADVIPWRIGRWYEIRVYAGKPTERQVKGFDEGGTYHELTLPDVKDLQWVDLVVTPVGRMAGSYPGAVPSMVFEMDDGQTAVMHDMDIWSAWEVDRP